MKYTKEENRLSFNEFIAKGYNPKNYIHHLRHIRNIDNISKELKLN